MVVMSNLQADLPEKDLNVQALAGESHESFVEHRFVFEAVPGERVPVAGSVPLPDDRRYPAIIFLYGIGMEMDFPHEIAHAMTEAGFAIFVMEQYGRGERHVDRGAVLAEIATLRKRLSLTILETRRLVDVLQSRPDIDPEHIYLWGASFGAMTGAASMAYDQRIRAGVFTAAAGDLPRIAAGSPRLDDADGIRWQRGIARILAEILRPFDPIRHVGSISPRPVLFQNAKQDEIFPPETVKALHDAAGQPKEIRWFESPHSRPPREIIEMVVEDGLSWLREQM